MRRHSKKLALVARTQARGQLHIPSTDEPDEEAELDEAMAFFGLEEGEREEAEIPTQKCCLWPCNVRAFNVWQAVQTQWRVGGNGREGLDYAGVESYLRSVPGLRPKARSELFEGLRAMESAVLKEYRKQQENQK